MNKTSDKLRIPSKKDKKIIFSPENMIFSPNNIQIMEKSIQKNSTLEK